MVINQIHISLFGFFFSFVAFFSILIDFLPSSNEQHILYGAENVFALVTYFIKKKTPKSMNFCTETLRLFDFSDDENKNGEVKCFYFNLTFYCCAIIAAL